MVVKTIDDIPYDVQDRWERKLKLIAKHINELYADIQKEIGPDANIFMDETPTFCIMDGDGNGNASARERQTHLIMSGPLVSMGAGAW